MRGSRRVYYYYEDETEDVPKNVTHVDVDPYIDIVPTRAFQECQNLVDVTFYEVKRLERHAFQYCVSLQKVDLPPPTMKIGIRCFDGCHKLMMADLSECRVWVLMTQCFRNCTSLEVVHMPRTLEVIARDAFRGCESLKHISMEHTQLRTFGKRAFSNCESLIKVRIPQSTEHVGRGAFAGCTSLTEAKVPTSLNLDRDEVFKNCPELQRISSYRVQQSPTVARRLPVSTSPAHSRNLQGATTDATQRSNAPAPNQVSTVTQALDEAKQENAVLSQRLKDVCEKLERYESQWSTIVDKLQSANAANESSHQNEQEQTLYARDKELEEYKHVVQKQNKLIRAMKLKFFEVAESEKRPTTERQHCASLKQAGGTITPVPIEAALDPDVSLEEFLKMYMEQPMEPAKLPNADMEHDLASVEQSEEGEICSPKPFNLDDEISTIDTVDFLAATTQLSEGSDEWQIM